MLAADPKDSFLRYALAMELRKEGQIDQSLELLRGLTLDSPPYVAAYFMAGQQLAEANRVPEAREYLRVGIEEARRQGDLHAAGEMSELLSQLGSLGE
jgi:predicted Zn-dependent protease